MISVASTSGHSLIVLLDLSGTGVLSDLIGIGVLSDLMSLRAYTRTIQPITVSQSQPIFMLDENLGANPFSC